MQQIYSTRLPNIHVQFQTFDGNPGQLFEMEFAERLFLCDKVDSRGLYFKHEHVRSTKTIVHVIEKYIIVMLSKHNLW